MPNSLNYWRRPEQEESETFIVIQDKNAQDQQVRVVVRSQQDSMIHIEYKESERSMPLLAGLV